MAETLHEMAVRMVKGKDAAYSKAMQRYKPIYDGYHGEQTQPVKIWHAAGGGRTR